ncbi:MAG TPA: Ig-like domain-containing protein [Verrucomicrobiae bacterium]|nr:Ig-like domain-containing protein [Verrucomicrobiae bacterium]
MASTAQNGWTVNLPGWVGSTAQFNWKPRLGGVYWLDSRAVVKQAAPNLTQSSRPVLVDIKSDAVGFGYRFDLNSWDSQSPIHTYYSWDGTDAGTPASPEDAMQIFGATGNAEFILNIPVPLHLTNSPSSNWGYDGYGYTWQTPGFYAAMVQYLFGAAGPQSEWQNLPTTMDFFSQPASFNWADLRARRGHVAPYPVVAAIIGEEPYNIEGEPTGALYGSQAEKFRVAIRNRGMTIPLGLHVHDGGYADDPNGGWFWPMMARVTASDFSYLDLEHYYQFSSVQEDFKRTFPVSVNPNAAYWMPQSQWKSDYRKFLWIVEDTRNAIRDDSAVPGLGDPSRWQLGWTEHGIQITSAFTYNDMFSAMQWANWLAESMRQNVAFDSAWTLLAEGFSHAQIQVRNGYVTRTPMFFAYQMAREFYGYDYLTNNYVSTMGSTTDGQGNAVQYPWTTVRTFRDPATGNIHLWIVNQSTNSAATVTGFENWNVIGWKRLSGASYAANNPLGVAGPEPIQTVSVALPALGQSLVVPPISVNHVILSGSGSTNVTDTIPPTVSMAAPLSGATVSGSAVLVSANAFDNVAVTGVQFKLDGANLGSVFTASPYSGTLDTTAIANGAHTLTATAWDAAGNRTTATPVTLTVSNVVSSLSLPTVSVAASPATATIGTANNAVLTFSRAGDTTLPLTVNYTLGGTAVKWTDYRTTAGVMPVSVTIPAGASLVDLTIVGVTNSTGANPETAAFTLNTDPGYTVGSSSNAVITIASSAVGTLPVVSVAATVSTAVIGTANYGAFTFTRTGDTSSALTVNYTLGGTATKWDDYRRPVTGDMPVAITIPAGASSYTMQIAAIGNEFNVNPETASLTLNTDPSYNVGSPNNATITIVSNTVVTLPAVTVSATAPNASRVGPADGVFTLARTGSTSAALTVNYSLGGTAVNGSDYNTLGASATIPAGAASVTLAVAPLPSANYVGAETAVLTLSANSAYTAGSPNTATVNIAGNSVPSSVGKAGGNLKITWKSVLNKTYRVAYKNSLADATWTNLSGLITATSTITSYTDTTASNKTQRYYVVFVTD